MKFLTKDEDKDMKESLFNIINDHRQIARQKGREPSRLVDVWSRGSSFGPPFSVSSLVVTAFDLFRRLFGDCTYSLFADIEGARPLNIFHLPGDRYRELTRGIKQYLAIKKCSVRAAFRDVTPEGLKLLSATAYEITAARVWVVKHQSLDPVYNPSRPSRPEIQTEVLVYSQILSPYLIKDVVGLILMYSVDPCLPNHVRCSKAGTDGARCNQWRALPSLSCRDHKNNPDLLSNHYLV